MQAVADLVPKSMVVADVGTDHGYIPIFLIQDQRAEKVLALDVRSGPLKRAAGHVEEKGLAGQIEVRRSDGLKGVKPGEADTVVISGLGGPLMIRILREGKDVVDNLRYLILQPQSEIADVRRYLTGAGFTIQKEDMVKEDGKYYFLMRAVPGKTEPYEEFEYTYGKKLLQMQHSILKEYLQKEQKKRERLLTQLTAKADSPGVSERKETLGREIGLIRQALACYA